MRYKTLFSWIAVWAGFMLWAQDVQVQGTVTDEAGQPLPGVNIVVKGTQKGTVTDFDGKYKISVPKGSTLLFSYLGYKDKELVIKQPGTYNVRMEAAAESLNQVVITAMGIKKKEKSLTYAVQQVKPDNLKTAADNPFTAIQGEVSGMTIKQTSGTPGAGVDILIRGITSLDPGRNNQPLIVIDGVPVSNDIVIGSVKPSAGSNAPNSANQFSFANRGLDIAPEDIASVSVLKGAAATALYGIRAANGAIIITTKRGQKGYPSFKFSSKVTVNDITKYAQVQKKWSEGYRGNARATMDPNNPDIRATQIRGYGPDKGVWLLDGAPYSFHTWGPLYSERDDPTIYFHDTYREFFRTGRTYDNSFSVSGGKDKYNYYMSLVNVNAKSIVPYTTYNKTSFRVRADYQFSPKFNIELTSNYIYTKSKLPNNGDKSIMSSLAYWSTSFPTNRLWGPDGRSFNYTPYWIDNPSYFAYISSLESEVNRFINGMRIKYDLTDKWNIVWRGGVDTYIDNRNRFVPPDLDVGTQVHGFVYNAAVNYRQLTSNTMLNYFNKNLIDGLELNFTLGHEIFTYNRSYASVRGEGLILPDYNHISNTTNLFTYERSYGYRLVGLFSEARFNYKDRVFLNVTGRNDWSSSLSKDNRSFFYPSVGLGFVFNDFIDKSKEWFSFGKLRLAYAEVGKDATPTALGEYMYMTNTLPGGQVGTYIKTGAGDINARPERQITKEIGVDLRFVNNRFRVDYTHFDRHNKDLLLPVPVPQSSGLTSVYRNVGEMQTWGDELLVSAKWINKEKFTWKTTVNWSTFSGKLIKLDSTLNSVYFGSGTAGVVYSMMKEGDYVGSLYSHTWKYTEDGQLILDSNGYPQEDRSEVKLVGNAFPDWTASISNDFQIGNFGFGFNIEYKKGGDVFDDFRRTAIRNGNAKATENRYVEYLWEGVQEDGNGGYVPNTTPAILNESWYRYRRNTYVAETMLEDGSWVKLRNIYLSYKLPRKFLKETFIKNVSFNLAVSNYVLWSKNEGWDPEGSTYSAGSNIYGFIGYSTPLTTNYSFGLTVDF